MIPLVGADGILSQEQSRVWSDWLSALDPPMPLGTHVTPRLVDEAIRWHNRGRRATPVPPGSGGGPRTGPLVDLRASSQVTASATRPVGAQRTTSPSGLGAFLAANLDPEQRRRAAFADLGDQLIRARWRR